MNRHDLTANRVEAGDNPSAFSELWIMPSVIGRTGKRK